jgi:hypothetical protein
MTLICTNMWTKGGVHGKFLSPPIKLFCVCSILGSFTWSHWLEGTQYWAAAPIARLPVWKMYTEQKLVDASDAKTPFNAANYSPTFPLPHALTTASTEDHLNFLPHHHFCLGFRERSNDLGTS